MSTTNSNAFRMGSGLNRRHTGQAEKPTHAAADAVQQPARDDDPIMSPILTAIADADIHQLLYIQQTKIPNTKGITDAEREELHQAARERFIELHTSSRPSVENKFSRGRWTANSLHTSGETRQK